MPNAHHHKFELDDYHKDFMNRCDVSVYIVPFDSLILTIWFFILKRYPQPTNHSIVYPIAP